MYKQASPPPDVTLSRGQACLICRRRKTKCDGQRPRCGQCMMASRGEKCEYSDIQDRTRTQVLEEHLAYLEARMRDIETSSGNIGSITLFDPHTKHHEGEQVAMAPGQNMGDLSPSVLELPSSGGAPSANPGGPELTPQLSMMLINAFLPHAGQLGFVLNVPRILTSLTLPSSHPSRPHPALLSSIHLWGLVFLNSPDFLQFETTYLAAATSALSTALGNPDPQNRIHSMQAEVLVAQYLLCKGRFLEGRYHINAAASLAISSGLHLIRSSNTPSASPSSSLLKVGNIFDLPAPRDVVEECERVGVFWSVYVADRCWSVTTGSPVVLSEDGSTGIQIDTPWPIDAEIYEGIAFGNGALTSSGTVRAFLSGIPALAVKPNESSSIALRAKASALFEYTHRLVTLWNQGPQYQGRIAEEFNAVERVITDFIDGLLPANQLANLSQAIHENYTVTHSLAHASRIRLHSVRANNDRNSYTICLSSANTIISILEYIVSKRFTFLDPIICSVWMLASKVFIGDVSNLRSRRDADSQSRTASSMAQIARISTGLAQFASMCPIMKPQVAKVHALLRSV